MDLTTEALRAAGYPFLDAGDVARVRTHPGFVRTMRDEVANFLATPQDSLALPQRYGRHYYSCFFVYFLHRRPEGVTLSSLQAVCASVGYPTAVARTVVDHLRFLKYIEPVEGGEDRRERRYAPTALMDAAFRGQFRGELAVAAAVEPDAARLLPRFGEPGVIAAFMEAFAIGMLIGARDQRKRALEMFFDRAAGMTILYRLLDGAVAAGDDMPPTGPVRCVVSDLARMAQVSRPHVIKFLRDAEAEGLLHRTSDQDAVFSPGMREGVMRYLAIGFATHGIASRWALRSADAVRV